MYHVDPRKRRTNKAGKHDFMSTLYHSPGKASTVEVPRDVFHRRSGGPGYKCREDGTIDGLGPLGDQAERGGSDNGRVTYKKINVRAGIV